MKEHLMNNAQPTPRPVSPPPVLPDEALVTDARGGLTPAQMVERKLMTLLQHAPLPVSQPQGASQRRGLS